MLSSDIITRFRFSSGKTFRIQDVDPADTYGLDIEKDEAKALLSAGTKRLAELQERLYAEDRWAILIILQAIDAAGKDSVIKHVMSGVNPQGCEVHSFKVPSPQELDHDYLWRSAMVLPSRGRVGIFNRSYYEEVLVVRVHPELLAREKLPPQLIRPDVWEERFEDIVSFEQYLAHNGIVLLKFFLHVSKDEQRRRLLKRIEDPNKRWKFSPSDIEERRLWDRYMQAYEDMIRHTAKDAAPWHVVPADHKWFTRMVVAATIVQKLEELNPKYPELDASIEQLERARLALMSEEP